MKKYFSILPLLPFLFFAACSTTGGGKVSAEEAPQPNSGVTLDAAIKEIGAYFARSLAPQSLVAMINMDPDKRIVSEYIFEELRIYLEKNTCFIFIERDYQPLIEKEMSIQLSGQVSDASAKSIGQQFGPQTLIYGKFSRLGANYRLVVNATDVERATSLMQAVTIKPDSFLTDLLKSPDTGMPGLDMANALYAGTGNPFRFTVQTDKTSGDYRDGEYMTMRIYSEKSVWFKVTHVDVNGNAQVIYPVSAQDNNFIKAGETRQIPDNTRYRMTAPYGQEFILVSAYTEAFTVERPANAAPLSNTIAVRGLIVENAETHARANPVATARFSYNIKP